MLNKDTETSKIDVVAYRDSPLLFEAAKTLIFSFNKGQSPQRLEAFFSTIVLVILQYLVA